MYTHSGFRVEKNNIASKIKNEINWGKKNRERERETERKSLVTKESNHPSHNGSSILNYFEMSFTKYSCRFGREKKLRKKLDFFFFFFFFMIHFLPSYYYCCYYFFSLFFFLLFFSLFGHHQILLSAEMGGFFLLEQHGFSRASGDWLRWFHARCDEVFSLCNGNFILVYTLWACLFCTAWQITAISFLFLFIFFSLGNFFFVVVAGAVVVGWKYCGDLMVIFWVVSVEKLLLMTK